MTGRRDDGYAIVAAVAALAVFAAVAYAVIAADRGDLSDLQAQSARARLEAAADAGLATAIEGLAIEDPAQRWPIDGRSQAVNFEGVKLTIRVEDELGKVPMEGLTEDQVRRLFTGAGARGGQVQTLVDAYQDWLSDSGDPRPSAARAARYVAEGISPRNSVPLTVDELARLNGMTPAIFARVRRVLTRYFGVSGAFSPGTASPLAVSVMSGGGADSPEVIERQRELAGERVATDLTEAKSLVGRAVTVVVRAQDSQGGALERRTVVEMSGKAAPAYYIREEQ